MLVYTLRSAILEENIVLGTTTVFPLLALERFKLIFKI